MGTDSVVEQYLGELQKALPLVRPVRVREIADFHKAKKYKELVRLVRSTMNLQATLVVGFVNSGGPKDNPTAPAWVEIPRDLPIHGTEAFKTLKLTVYFRKSFLERSDYDEVAMAIAHELSHIVLDSIRHPLRGEEKAVDLTAMLLGFRLLYRSACYKEVCIGNVITRRTLGYLSQEEVELANSILAKRHRRARIDYVLSKIARHKIRLLVSIGALTAIIAIAAIVVHLLPLLPWDMQTPTYLKGEDRQDFIANGKTICMNAQRRRADNTEQQLIIYCDCFIESLASTVSMEELRYGASRGTQPESLRQKIAQATARCASLAAGR